MHYPSDASGFSATLFRERATGEFTLSFRSTESAFGAQDRARNPDLPDLGGDWARDGRPGADGEINAHGFALAQIDSMERLYAELRTGRRWDIASRTWIDDARLDALKRDGANAAITVTGYSLGGHLATTFAILHPDELTRAYTFNSAGVGGFGTTTADVVEPTRELVAALLADYRRILHYDGVDANALEAALAFRGLSADEHASLRTAASAGASMRAGGRFLGDNLYTDPLHRFAVAYLGRHTVAAGVGPLFSLDFSLQDGLGDAQLFDRAVNFVANLGEPNSFTTERYTVPAWSDRIVQVYGHGEFFDPELVANSGYHAPATKIFIEDQPLSRGLAGLKVLYDGAHNWEGEFGDTHAIAGVIDSLAVLDLLQSLDPGVTNADLTSVARAISNRRDVLDPAALPPEAVVLGVLAPLSRVATGALATVLFEHFRDESLHDADALELIVNALHRQFLGTDPGLRPILAPRGAGDIDARNELHEALDRVRAAVEALPAGSSVRFVRLTDRTGAEIAALARPATVEALGYRHALRELLPFAIVSDVPIGTAERTQTLAALSEEYIDSRAGFLAARLARDLDNLAVEAALPAIAGQYYQDIESGVTISPVEPEATAAVAQARFGSEDPARTDLLMGGIVEDRLFTEGGHDVLVGGRGLDHLEGGAGDDTLIGGPAELVDDDPFGQGEPDRLLGGAGFDTYYAGWEDTIDDADGRGQIYFRGARLLPGFRDAGDPAGAYTSVDGAYGYRLMGTTLTVRAIEAGGPDHPLRIENYQPGALGIDLRERPGPAAPFVDADTGNLLVASGGGTRIVSRDPLDRVLEFELPHGALTRIEGRGGADRIVALDPVPGLVIYGDYAGDATAGGAPGDDFLSFDRIGTQAGDPGAGVFLFGEAGDDVLLGAPSADVLSGGADHDFIQGRGGRDAMSGESGNDWLEGGEDADLVAGGPGRDRLFGGAGADHLDGGAEADWLYGDAGNAPYFRDGEDRTWDGATETLRPIESGIAGGPAFTEFVIEAAAAGADLLDGGAGNDSLYGGAGADTLRGGAGDDWLEGESGDDALVGDDGHDLLWGDKNPETYARDHAPVGDSTAMIFRRHADGADAQGDDRLEGGAGVDQLFGGGGNDVLAGGAEGDYLAGGAGDDRYAGDGGDDVLVDEAGDERYTMHPDFGRDTILDQGGVDVLELPVPAHRVSVARDGADVLLESAADTVRIAGWFGGAAQRIERIEFADGTAWAEAEITRRALMRRGTDGADDLRGVASEANDLAGGAGDDQLLGGERADVLDGGPGNDLVRGGAGEDRLLAGGGNDFLDGGAGDDRYELGPGAIVIDDRAGGSETVRLPMGVESVWAARIGAELLLTYEGGTTTVLGYQGDPGRWRFETGAGLAFEPPPAPITAGTVPAAERVVFVARALDAQQRAADTLNAALTLRPGYYGSVRVDVRTTEFPAFPFTYLGDDEDGEPVYFGALGGAFETTTITGRDLMLVRYRSDAQSLAGAQSDDRWLRAGAMHDYATTTDTRAAWFDYGSRYDLTHPAPNERRYSMDIVDIATAPRTPFGGGDGAKRGTVTTTTHALRVLHIDAGDGNDVVAEQDAFGSLWVWEPQRRSHQPVWEAWNVWQSNDHAGNYAEWYAGRRAASYVIDAGAGDDRAFGGYLDDWLEGGAGDDLLHGFAGADTLVGGAGQDRLEGGHGADTYLVGANEGGVDVILDDGWAAVDPGADVVRLDRESTAIDVYRVPDVAGRPALLLAWGATDARGGALVLEPRADDRDGSGIEAFAFTDTTLTHADIAARARSSGDPGVHLPLGVRMFFDSAGALQGTPYADDLDLGAERWLRDVDRSYAAQRGLTPTADLVNGGAGADRLIGAGGGDRLLGGPGADVIDGGDGNDRLGGGSVLQHVVYGSSDMGADGDDALLGGDGDDWAEGGGGADRIDGGTGNDLLLGQDGRDVLAGGEGDDSLHGGFDDDYLAGDAGNDVLNGEAGADDLAGGAGADRLFGGTEDDRLDGGADDDVLIGAEGDDRLLGGAGNDQYLVNPGDGRDVIDDAEGAANELHLGNGTQATSIEIADLVVVRVEDALRIDYGAEDSVTVAGWFADPGRRLARVVGFEAMREDDEVVESFALTGDEVELLMVDRHVVGTSAADVLNGGAGADDIAGGGGDDRLDAGDGDDTLNGGTGNDRLAGGAGDDTYVFHRGDGVDHIRDLATDGAPNTLRFGPGIEPDELSLGLGSLQLRIGTSGDAVHLDPFDAEHALSGPRAIDRFVFADGSVLRYAQLLERGFELIGTESAESVTGTDVGDRIRALGGNDRLDGGAGADTLEGMAGADWLRGGDGEDELRIGNDGRWGSGFVALNVGSPGLRGSSARVSLRGRSRSLDVFDGGPGVDALAGTPGPDTVFLDDGYSARYPGTAGARIVAIEAALLGAGDDLFDLTSTRYAYGDILVDAGSGHDVIWTGAGNDDLRGGDGNDQLDGGAGADRYDGGAGNDVVFDGSGDDHYRFHGGDGQDRIRDRAGSDVLRFEGAGAEDIWLSRSADDLILALRNRDDRVAIDDWYANADARIERFEVSDGARALLAADVQRLVDAMAAFGAPPAGDLGLTPAASTELLPVIAAAWQPA